MMKPRPGEIWIRKQASNKRLFPEEKVVVIKTEMGWIHYLSNNKSRKTGDLLFMKAYEISEVQPWLTSEETPDPNILKKG